MDRYVLDAKSGEYLLFPDLATLRVVASDVVGDLIYVSVAVAMSPSTGDGTPQPARPIVLTDEDLRLSAPTDPRVSRFKFVKKAGLTGSATLTCRANQWGDVQRSIAERAAAYMPLFYRGNSEIFWSPKRIAATTLSRNDLQDLSVDRRLFLQLWRLRKWLSERTDIGAGEIDDWLQACLDSKLPVGKFGASYSLEIPTQPLELVYVKNLETTVAVTESNAHTKYVWSNE